MDKTRTYRLHKMVSTQNKSPFYGDATVIRLVAAQIVVLGMLVLLTNSIPLAAFLLLDFGIRAFSSQTSALKWLAQKLTRRFGAAPKPIFLPPKKFAALLGFIFTAFWLLFLIFGKADMALVVGSLLLLCAMLESVFELCVGCYVYNWVIAPWLPQNRR